MKVGVIGLGKLGACMACVYAKHDFEVVGVDVNKETVLQMQRGQCPVEAVEEKGLAELLKTVPLTVSTDYGVLKGCEIVFIIVPTPSRNDGRYDNKYIVDSLKELCPQVESNKVKPLVVIKSTVAPGSCDNEFMPLLGKGMRLCYSAEMVGLGGVIGNLEHPGELLIGEQNREAGDKLREFYHQMFFGRKMPPLRRMSLWNAELSKLALNVFLISKVTLANTIARMCDRTPTGNVNDVLEFVGGDRRIGEKFLETGLGMGGPCFPRDCRALISVAGDELSDIPEAVDRVNIDQVVYIYNTLKPLPKVISVLGVTYKPDIQLLDASKVVLLISQMIIDGVEVRLHDPKGLPGARKTFEDKVYYAESIEDCLKGSELAVVGTAWDCYRVMDLKLIKKNMKKPVVYDCWRIWNPKDMRKHGIRYHAFGVCD